MPSSMFSRRRMTVLRNVLFLVPLALLIWEHSVGTLLVLQKEDARVPLEVESILPLLIFNKTISSSSSINSGATEAAAPATLLHRRQDHVDETLPRVPIEVLTRSNEASTCKHGLIAIQDRHIPQNNNDRRLIPRIVHQTSRSRCVTRNMARITKGWLLQEDDQDTSTEWSYYFHDDASVNDLFLLDWPEFPHLHHVLACLQSGTMRADLWRYLVLYEYGGVYADLDTKPNKFTPNMIINTTDGFFVVEQYHILSQWFMAMSPRHPLMYYTIQHALLSILQQLDTSTMDAPYVTGPHALLHGYSTFRKDVGVIVPRSVPKNKCVKAGNWVGTDQRSITVVGVGENEKEFVIREAITRPHKIQEYQQMGMKHFSGETTDKQGRICLSAIYHEHMDRRVLGTGNATEGRRRLSESVTPWPGL